MPGPTTLDEATIGQRTSSLPKALARQTVFGGRLSWNWLAALLILTSMVCGVSTYTALTETHDFAKDSSRIIWLLNVDLIVLLLLMSLIARRIVGLFSGRRRGVAGSRLHVRLVFIFSFLAAAPAVLMTIFSAIFLHVGVESWFNQRVHTAIMDSQAVAEAYLDEHKQVIRVDTLAMANDLDRDEALLANNPRALGQVLNTQSLLRNLSEAEVIDRDGRIIAVSDMTLTLAFDKPPLSAMRAAENGDVEVMTGEKDDRVRALVKLNNYAGTYLYVGRAVDPVVLSHVTDTRQAAAEYSRLEAQRSKLVVSITLIYIVIALLLMLTATWFGLQFARQLVVPIGLLIAATDQVRAGDLTARVPDMERGDEFDNLGRAFNRMTAQIQQQRDELITANRQLDQRRHFTETVLAGVSAGIVGIDREGRITLANNSASELFARSLTDLAGQPIGEIVPGVESLLDQARQRPNRISQGEIPWRAGEDLRRVFLVRVALETTGPEEMGAVLTFDDITELQSAQRKAAWADVARRIAHEIKNPLTPIQLSAERLKRKYLKQITEDRDIFSKCTDTIIYHVGDIGRMVNEFSAFARMPEPVMRREDIAPALRDLLVLQEQAHPGIAFRMRGEERSAIVLGDIQQIRQAFTNIIQNAVEAVGSKMELDGHSPGHIDVTLLHRTENAETVIVITDDGVGLPKDEDPNRLTEPYVTHRDKGTGLGLAIVKKIMEDHKGRIVIGAPEWLKAESGWTDLGGATFCLILPELKDAEWNNAAA
jgi:two-component system nitrogen regulation sensor histidine kinase NtrY